MNAKSFQHIVHHDSEKQNPKEQQINVDGCREEEEEEEYDEMSVDDNR